MRAWRSRRRRWLKRLSGAAAIAALAGAIWLSQQNATPVAASIDRVSDRGRFRVIDGDTIENTRTQERIRLANIDTAETGDHAGCAAERRHGERAARTARNLLVTARTVEVRRTGRGRSIAYVVVDGRDMGQTLIDLGLARPWGGREAPWCGADGALVL